jgi:FtsH-binding integral membrane protein
MPKPKPSQKQKQKAKLTSKAQTQTPGITANKSYWLVLAVLFAVVSTVFGATMGLTISQTVILVITIVLLIGVIGFIRVTPSNLSLSKRATFLFAGASIIGFSIWAAITLSGLMTPVAQESGEVFTAVTSFAICLTVGVLIGEMLGRSKKIQDRLFLGLKN